MYTGGMRFRPLLDPNVDRQDARCKFKACSITRNGDKLVAGTEDGRVVMYTLAQGKVRTREEVSLKLPSGLHCTNFALDATINKVAVLVRPIGYGGVRQQQRETTGVAAGASSSRTSGAAEGAAAATAPAAPTVQHNTSGRVKAAAGTNAGIFGR